MVLCIALTHTVSTQSLHNYAHGLGCVHVYKQPKSSSVTLVEKEIADLLPSKIDGSQAIDRVLAEFYALQ